MEFKAVPMKRKDNGSHALEDGQRMFDCCFIRGNNWFRYCG